MPAPGGASGLRPAAIDDLGLIGALQEQVAHYHASGVQITIDAPESLPSLPAAVEVACYRIAQEALTNVVRHVRARYCTLTLTVDDRLRLEIQDDGKGIPADRQPGVGLASMRERAEELCGTCRVSPDWRAGRACLLVCRSPEEEGRRWIPYVC